MIYGYRLVLLTAVALTTAGASASVADNVARSAQERSGTELYIRLAQVNTQNQQNQQKKPPPAKVVAPAAPAVAPKAVAPRNLAPAVAPKIVGPAAAPKFVAPAPGPKVVSPAFGPKAVGPATSSPNFVGPGPGPGASGQRRVGPSGNAARAVAIRGASRATIGGQNFSIRRGSYRAYRGGRWRTYVGLGALGAVMFGAALYYPYAYIDAPPDFCDGETEDGCLLQWQEVQTFEGEPDFQCVAYCPRQ